MDHLERATALRSAGDLPAAMDEFRLAMKQDPLNPELWYQTAMAAVDLRDYRYASSMLEAYVRFQPGRPGPFFDLAYCLMRVGDYAGAVRALERTITLRPHHPRALIALGQMLYGLGRADEAYAAHSGALALDLATDDDRSAGAVIRLLRGDYELGWPEFERRWGSRAFNSVPTWPANARHWNGGATPGQTVYVHAEGGYGDTVMFSRYFPWVAERADRVVLLVQPALERLLGYLPGRYEFAPDATAAPADAVHVSTWSLPTIFGTRLNTVPAQVPYYGLPSSTEPRPRGGRLRVGIAWAGNRVTTHDLDRSCPDPTLLSPLFAVPGVEWVSLQVGDDAPAAAGMPIAPCPVRGDFVETAELVRSLDLVISVDTAVAHLAGALAIPTWVMVPAMPEFRWLLDRETSPWYPNHRLFRRGRTDDWAGLAARMAPELAAVASAHAAG